MTLPHDPYAPQDPYAVDANGSTVEPEPVEAPVVTVPKGTSHEVLDWVGDDKTRARLALDAENAHDKPRKGLVDDLQEKLGQ